MKDPKDRFSPPMAPEPGQEGGGVRVSPLVTNRQRVPHRGPGHLVADHVGVVEEESVEDLRDQARRHPRDQPSNAPLPGGGLVLVELPADVR